MKNKNIKIIDFIQFGIFPGTILLSVGNSYDELIETINKEYKSGRWKKDFGEPLWSLGISEDKEFIDKGYCFALKRELFNKSKNLDKTLFYIILKDQFDFSDQSMCTLAHEVLHICQFYLPDVLDRNKEHEAEAYLHSHIMREALRIIRGKK